jgi:hypothetical protein
MDIGLKVLNKRGVMVHYQPNAVQQALIGGRTGRDLVLKSRQMGISTALQAAYFVEAITRTALVATMAHDAATTAKLRRMADRFYDSLDPATRPPRGLNNHATTTYPATGSEVTIATAGNVNVGRGGTYTHVHGSEVAFWEDAAAIMAGLMQGVSGGWVALESTPNGAQGWFYERCMEALEGDPAWKLHFLPWWRDPTYRLPLVLDAPPYDDDEARLVALHGLSAEQIAWRRTKQRELKHLFAQEYPEDPRACFLLSGQCYFGVLSGVFSAPFGVTPQAGRRYVAGLDFAQTTDFTVLSVVDAESRAQVDLLRLNRLPWAELRRQIVQTCQRWQVTALWAESNSIGGPNIEALAAAGLPVLPLTMNASTKPALMQALSAALNEGGFKLLDVPEQRRELAAFQARQTVSGHWTYAARPPEHDDTVIANALAWHGVLNSAPVILFEA